jgi:hypothetical protein
MKWCIENSTMESTVCNKLKESVQEGNFSKELFNSIFKYTSSDMQLTFRSDNLVYIDKLVNKIVGLCYIKNFVFDIANDNQQSLYKSTRIQTNQPKDTGIWYYSFSKISHKQGGLSYHFNFSNNGHNNFHLLLVHDNNIVE